jgi:hypothetical protein
MARPALAAFLLATVATLATEARSSGQALPSPLAPSNPAPIVYAPPERLAAGPAAPQHVVNVFLPRGPVPPAGWPVVLATGYGGGNAVPPLGSLARTGQSAPLWNLVAAGIAVVHYGSPGLGGRRGLWYPPGHPSGRYESYRPADDNPEKSAVWALQWVKVQALYPFDVTRVGLRGSSGGAVLAIRTAMGPERARATGSAQVRASTRVAAILAIQPPTSAWALEQGPELTIAFPGHLEQAANPGVPATQLSQVTPELQKAYSLMREAFGTSEARAHNVAQPICLVYGDPVLRVGGQVATMELDATGFPLLHDKILQPLQHDSWFGYVFWKSLIGLSPAAAAFHAQHSVFAVRDTSALAAPLDLHTRTFTGTVMGPAAAKLGHDWLVGRLKGGVQARREDPRGPVAWPARACSDDGALARLSEPRASALVLGVRGPAGAPALLRLVRGLRPGEPCGPGRNSRGLGTPRVVRLAPEGDGWTRVGLGPVPAQSLEGLRVECVVRAADGVRRSVLELAD